MVRRPRGDNQARLDDLGTDRDDTGADSAGQSGDLQQLSQDEEAADESVAELAEEDQAMEASFVDGVEDAGDHPQRPVHTHEEYGRPDDQLPPENRRRK